MRTVAMMIVCALAFAAVSVPWPQAVAQDTDGENSEPQITKAEWDQYLNVVRASAGWKLASKFQKSELEPLLPEWSETLGRPLEIHEVSYIIDANAEVYSTSNVYYEFSTEWDDERRAAVYSLHKAADGESSNWIVPNAWAEAQEFRYVEAITAGDPFARIVRNRNHENMVATDLVTELCAEIGCNCVLPIHEARVRVHIKEAQVGDVIREVGQAAGLNLGPTDMRSAGTDVGDVRDKFTYTQIEELGPAEAFRIALMDDVTPVLKVIVTARKPNKKAEQ